MSGTLFSLKGKTAVVTGSGSGIGQGIALGLAEAGADIVAVYHSSTGGTEEKIRAMGGRCVSVCADVSRMESIDQIMNAALEAFGKIDILVNAAGQIYREPALTHPEARWDQVMEVNAKIPFFLAQRIARQMVEKGIRGRIINIASMNSYFGGILVPGYSASKHAVVGLTKAMSNEWAGYGICVNALAPGWIATKMTTAVRENETRNAEIISRIPAGRWGRPEDFAGPAVFLASEASAYVTGSTLPVDGGFLAR